MKNEKGIRNDEVLNEFAIMSAVGAMSSLSIGCGIAFYFFQALN